MLLPHKYTDTSMAHRHTTYVHTYWVHNLVTSFYQQHIEIQQMPRMASMRPKISFSIFAQSAMCWFRRDVDGFDGEADFVEILQRMQNIILARFSDFSRAEKNWNVTIKCFLKKISFLLFVFKGICIFAYSLWTLIFTVEDIHQTPQSSLPPSHSSHLFLCPVPLFLSCSFSLAGSPPCLPISISLIFHFFLASLQIKQKKPRRRKPPSPNHSMWCI